MAKLFNQILTSIDGFVWGVPLIVLILAVGVFLTIRVKGLQIRLLPRAIKELFVNEKSGDSGEVSSFAALCTALSATIGTGNIVGVATALVAGGPGALFWMWVAAFGYQICGVSAGSEISYRCRGWSYCGWPVLLH